MKRRPRQLTAPLTNWKKVTDDRHAGPSHRRDKLHGDQHPARDHFHHRGGDRGDRVVLLQAAAAPRHAVAMAHYRRLAEEAVANQQELRAQLAELTAKVAAV